MKRKSFIAGLLSLIFPGLGQIYCGNSTRGRNDYLCSNRHRKFEYSYLAPVSIANPVIPPTASVDARAIWIYWIPKVGDLLSFWSIIFWLWAIFDAIAISRKK